VAVQVWNTLLRETEYGGGDDSGGVGV
jgi:hypothetical protein